VGFQDSSDCIVGRNLLLAPGQLGAGRAQTNELHELGLAHVPSVREDRKEAIRVCDRQQLEQDGLSQALDPTTSRESAIKPLLDGICAPEDVGDQSVEPFEPLGVEPVDGRVEH
jgi:hypothetical protein